MNDGFIYSVRNGFLLRSKDIDIYMF